MTVRALARASIGAMMLEAATASQSTQIFRSGTVSVAVHASVKRGNRVVANLTAADFRLTDNGMPQSIDSVSIETIPIDVTLFLDTSGSTAGKLQDMKEDVRGIIRLLRPADRFRLLTIGDSVREPVPWVPAGTPVNLSFGATSGISLIHDALTMALLHRPETDRRHLVVGLTDRRDCGSVVSAAQLRELAGRSESVLQLIEASGAAGDLDHRIRSCTPRARVDGPDLIQEAAERTGGESHQPSGLFRASSLLRSFRTILDDFRQSYVLRFTPTDSNQPGWHALDVEVPSLRGVTIRARQGYYAAAP